MKSERLSFKRVVSFQTYSCIAFAILAVVLSLFGIVRVKPVYVFEDYFGEQKAEDRVSDAVTEDFSIGMIDVISGIPQLAEAIRFDGGEFSELEAYGTRIGKYLDSGSVSEKSELTMYAYLTFSALDESLFVGVLMLVQLWFVIYLPVLSIFCAAYVLIRFFTDGKSDYFTCYQDAERGIKPLIPAILLGIVVAALLPSLTLSFFGILLVLALVVFAVFNVICMRLREHTKAQRRYLTVLQIGSLVNLIVTALYYVGLVASGLIPKLFELCAVETWELADVLLRSNGELSLEFEEIFVVFLTAAFVVINLSARRMAEKSICRSFCNTQKKRYGNMIYADTFIGRATLPMWGMLIVVFLFDSLESAVEGAELAGLVLTAAGALLILLSEIAIRLLIGTVCIDLGKSGAENVLRGDVYDRRDGEV